MKEYFAFQWHITDTCDQRCEHCYIFSEDNNIPLTTMKWDDMLHVLDNCAEMAQRMDRIPYFYITGGDPILHPDFWRLLELLKEHGIDFGILGNPFHLNDDVCRRLKSYGCDRYQLSIDGMRETHDFIRKPGSFDTTLEKITCIRNAGMKCAIMTTVSRTNAQEMPDIIDTVVAHKADIFAFARYCPTSFEKSTHLSPQEYRMVLDMCWSKFEQHKDCDTTFNLKDHLWTPYLQEKGLFTIPDGLDEDVIYDGCHCGRDHITILPSGDIYACRRLESTVGNALIESMYDIFHCEKMAKYRQYDNFEKCGLCELKRFCRGCPAVTYGYTHNFYGADPQCWKEVSTQPVLQTALTGSSTL